MEMDTKEEVERKRTKSVIDYRRYYINYISAQIQDLLKELRKINDMPEGLISERAIKERMEWTEIGEQNRELSNKGLEDINK